MADGITDGRRGKMTANRRSKDLVVAKDVDDPMGAGTQPAELSPVRSDRRPATKGHLERGWVKHRLIRDFALGEKSGIVLSEQYGVSRAAISAFKKRYSLEIEEVRNNLADEYAGVWVAQKIDRIREYQQAAEKMAAGSSPRNAEVLVSILKAVAEELGQLPARTQVNVSQENVTYEIVGISPEDI
jgi:hypothetical protein